MGYRFFTDGLCRKCGTSAMYYCDHCGLYFCDDHLIKVKVPAGKSEELHSKLNELTHGSVSYEIKEK